MPNINKPYISLILKIINIIYTNIGNEEKTLNFHIVNVIAIVIFYKFIENISKKNNIECNRVEQ